ncbi:MAG: purine-binding chemotaxis protein CheW [Nitrospirae bacterium]|nr:purine-binding chemotaxis protein CheW [Nitrospirota bacterium]
MNKSGQLFVFLLDGQRYAVPLTSVSRVIRAIMVSRLPGAPEIVEGVINVHGEVIPVINIRKRFGLPEREMDIDDQIIIAHTPKLKIAFIADSVEGVIEGSDQAVSPMENIFPHVEYVEGVITFDGKMVFIHDLEKDLKFNEEELLSSKVNG